MFIGRKNELQFLEDKYRSKGGQLIVVYGRRRIGKTETLRKFCEGKDHVFYTCTESTNEKQGVNQREWEDEGNNIKICVYIEPEGNIKEIVLEEYVIGVVAAEMPAEFAFEALKAQAVAARTYAYGRLKGIYKDKDDLHANADICTDFSHCQA